MTWFRSLCAAFSMYSRIPVPFGNWDKMETKYAIGLFPLVGAVIGVLSWLWMWATQRLAVPGLPDGALLIGRVLTTGIIPVLVTGGIHVDGYIDTSDALHSWADRAKKLQILSDPHIGAFSVISLLVLAAFWISALAVIVGSGDGRYFGVLALEYMLARALSGSAAVLFRNARGEGTLWAITDFGDKARRANLALLLVQGVGPAAAMILLKPAAGCAAAAASCLVWAHYRSRAYREFGGITGDLEGWFLCRCETAAACALAVTCICGM